MNTFSKKFLFTSFIMTLTAGRSANEDENSRPLDVWAIRSVLDRKPRMLTVALDTANCCWIDLRDTLRWQQRTHALARQYGRQQLRGEIRAAQHRLFHRPEHRSFRQAIYHLFS